MSAQEELVLLERVFLRIGSAETDEQLESVLTKFLPPVLLKLSSPEEVVRKKIMELLVHINKRLKSRTQIQLPMDILLSQYGDPSATSFAINFTIIYLKMGYPRMETTKQVQLIPKLLSCLEGKPQQHQDSILNMIMPVLQDVKFPPNPEECKHMFGIREQQNVASLLSEFMLDFLLLPYRYGPHIVSSRTGSSPIAPPGLSQNAYKRVLGEQPLNPEQLEQAKLGIVKFVAGGIYPEIDIVPHLIVASSDTRHSVASIADLELKRISGIVDWNHKQLVSKLFSIFMGISGNVKKEEIRAELKRTPANTRIRLKIFPYLLKSQTASTTMPSAVQVIFESIYGVNKNLKLKTMALQFVHSTCSNCSEERLNLVSTVLMSGMLRLVTEQEEYLLFKHDMSGANWILNELIKFFIQYPDGSTIMFEYIWDQAVDTKIFWHSPISNESLNVNLRFQEPRIKGMAYVAIGMLGTKLPDLVTKNIAVIQTFFDALTREDKDTRIAIQESLSILAKSFRSTDQNVQRLIESLISTSIENPDSLVRQMAVHYATTVFPPDHIPSRYILLLAAGDSIEEVREEAKKTLHQIHQWEPHNNKDKIRPYPQFSAFVSYMTEKAAQRMSAANKTVIGTTVVPFNVLTYIEVLHFMKACLSYSAGIPIDQISSKNSSLVPSFLITKYIKHLLCSTNSVDVTSVHQYLTFIIQFLQVNSESTIIFNCLEVIAGAADILIGSYKDRLFLFKKLMVSTQEQTREYASQLVCLIISYSDDDDFTTQVTELMENIKSQNLEAKHGSLIALGYVIGHKLYLLKQKPGCDLQQFLQTDWATESVKLIASLLQCSQPQLRSAACVSLGEIARNGPLPLPDESGDTDNKMEDSETLTCSKSALIKALGNLLKESKSLNKLYERAAMTLGYLCVGDPNFPHNKDVAEQLLQSAYHDMEVDIHFSVGEAFACVCLGPSSSAARNAWIEDIDNYEPSKVNSDTLLQWLLREILQKYIVHTKTSVRQASSVWLLILLKRCGNQEIMKTELKYIQNSFLNLLADTNDVVQDIAAKGLSMLYELGDKTLQKELVSLLVETLTTGRRSTISVTDETKIFEEGLLGKSPMSGGLSTYKELCSLASDLNQPELIYKFMHLANHNAIWNSRKGAAFGFGIIAQQAGNQLKEHLHVIVPKLYRYQFDPNSSVRQSFNSIWHAIVPNPQNTIDLYLKEILQDIIKNLTDPQWRVRESCCRALSDLLRGRSVEDLLEYLEVLWETCFRVRDDIKETVRNAADSALKTLSKTCVKFCDANSGSSGEKLLPVILPVLVKHGLTNPLAEVRAISLSTIVQISKSAGSMLKPHLPLLFVALLEALSVNEPNVINYLSVRLDKSSQEKLDTQRIAASQSTPMMETINHCVQYVDDSVLKELIPRLTDLIRHSVALGTKGGCAHLVISLVFQCPRDLHPYSGKLLSAFISGLGERNGAIRKSYAKAIGHLVKVSKDSSVEKLISRLHSWYMEKEEEYIHSACAYAIHSMALHSSDVFRAHSTQVLPLVFFAMHEKIPKEKNEDNLWEEIWMEFTPGTESGIMLYLDEILKLVQSGLDSQSWLIKQQAANAVITVTNKIGKKLGPKVVDVINVLISSLSGRTWTGKESLLHALTAVCVNCIEHIQQLEENRSGSLMQQVIETLLRESRKENLQYKEESLKSLGEILEKYEIDRFSELYHILQPILTKDQNSNISDEEKISIGLDAKLQFSSSAFQVLGQSWPKIKNTQDEYKVPFCKLLVTNFDVNTWKIQLSILTAMKKLISRLQLNEIESNVMEDVNTVVDGTVYVACKSSGMIKYSALRIESLNIMDQLIIKLKENKLEYFLGASFRTQLKDALNLLLNDDNPVIKDKALEIIRCLNELSS